MVVEGLIALAALAGRTVVAAASTDAWDACKRGFVRLLGRGDPEKEQRAEQRLEGTRQQLAGTDSDQVREAQAAEWRTRLADLLQENPDAEADLRTLVQQIQAQLPAGAVSAAGHSVAAGRDVNITASGGGARGRGNPRERGAAKPYPAGSGEPLAGPRLTSALGPVAGRDFNITARDRALAVGNLVYQQPEIRGRPVSLAPRPAMLAGREELLAQLHARLTEGDEPWPRIVALHGLGGAGKTSVAVEYAHRYQAMAGVAGVVWQFSAEDPAVLTAEFSRLAAQLGAVGLLDSRDPVAAVHAVLADAAAPWLLVFDNAADQASVRAFLPPAGNGRVLITTRSPLWPPGQGLEVPVLDIEVAAGFLTDRTDDPDDHAATDLAVELGGLPLALEQAAAYIQATVGSLARYLADFRQRRFEMLGRGEPTGYDATVATTWALAFGQLEQSNSQAAGLLRLLACCAPEPVPLRPLLQAGAGLDGQLGPDVAPLVSPLIADSLAAGDAVAALRRYSLVTPAGDGLVSVHRLVQAVTLDQMPADLAAKWQEAAAALIEAALPDDPGSPADWPAFAALLPHARAALAPASDGTGKIAAYLRAIGNYAAALDLQQQTVRARQTNLGAEHPRTLTARANLASLTADAGDAVAARDQLTALLPVMERVYGAEHPATLTTRANLARSIWGAGDAVAARDQYDALLPIMNRVLGAEDPATLTARRDLARWIGDAGDAVAARDQYAALLPVVERVYGAEDPATLTTQASLAYWAGEAGDAAAARDQYTTQLQVRERLLGAEHPATLTARSNLARWTGEAGDAAAARDQYAELLQVRERLLGAEHPATLTSRSDLAHWTRQAQEAEQAQGRELK